MTRLCLYARRLSTGGSISRLYLNIYGEGLGVDFMRSLIWQPHGSRISVRSFCRRASRPCKQRCILTGKSLVTFVQGSIFRKIHTLARLRTVVRMARTVVGGLTLHLLALRPCLASERNALSVVIGARGRSW